ncbi:MAG: glycosyltransferase [Chthoniobacter sp.]|nr:glycosyltransferase [Chthoniobacter sp.]
MNVLFAPDWRNGVPYQRLLAQALEAQGVHLSYLSHYKRILPLTRLMRCNPTDLLHLHWPEAYYARMRDSWDNFRRARFVFDLTMATRRTPFVLTAHNLCEHNLQHLPFARINYATAYRRANLVFAHSAVARDRLVETYGVDEANIRIIPHGDLSVVMPPPISRDEARAKLGLPEGPICLMFGAVEPYKGQEEVLAYWKEAQPAARLLIVGKPDSHEYGQTIRQLAEGLPNVTLHFQWLTDPELALFLCAADCTLFNYRTIFTSGAAALARSWGLPILIPTRLDTVDLAEPDPRVLRFGALDATFPQKLAAALAIPADFEAAEPWRQQTSWSHVAELTIAGYREALGLPAPTAALA